VGCVALAYGQLPPSREQRRRNQYQDKRGIGPEGSMRSEEPRTLENIIHALLLSSHPNSSYNIIQFSQVLSIRKRQPLTVTYGDILGDWYGQPSAHYCQQHPPIPREEAYARVGGREKSVGRESRYQFYFYCRQQGIWPQAVSGYSPLAEREKLLPFCPVYNIQPGYPPTLLLHGDQDSDVPFQQSLQMSQALTQQGIYNRLMIIGGGEHGFDQDTKNPEVKRALDEVVNFLREQVI